jgi:ADP-ribosylglycohydrolase
MINSMLGALVGDAAGATLEFCHREITEEMALKAMTMPGGGNMRVGPGQITDDGELHICTDNYMYFNTGLTNSTGTVNYGQASLYLSSSLPPSFL